MTVQGDGDCSFHALALFDGHDGGTLRIEAADFLRSQTAHQPGFEAVWLREAAGVARRPSQRTLFSSSGCAREAGVGGYVAGRAPPRIRAPCGSNGTTPSRKAFIYAYCLAGLRRS